MEWYRFLNGLSALGRKQPCQWANAKYVGGTQKRSRDCVREVMWLLRNCSRCYSSNGNVISRISEHTPNSNLSWFYDPVAHVTWPDFAALPLRHLVCEVRPSSQGWSTNQTCDMQQSGRSGAGLFKLPVRSESIPRLAPIQLFHLSIALFHAQPSVATRSTSISWAMVPSPVSHQQRKHTKQQPNHDNRVSVPKPPDTQLCFPWAHTRRWVKPAGLLPRYDIF